MAGFGLEDAEDAADAVVGLGFGMFLPRQHSLPRFRRDGVHPVLCGGSGVAYRREPDYEEFRGVILGGISHYSAEADRCHRSAAGLSP